MNFMKVFVLILCFVSISCDYILDVSENPEEVEREVRDFIDFTFPGEFEATKASMLSVTSISLSQVSQDGLLEFALMEGPDITGYAYAAFSVHVVESEKTLKRSLCGRTVAVKIVSGKSHLKEPDVTIPVVLYSMQWDMEEEGRVKYIYIGATENKRKLARPFFESLRCNADQA